MKVFGLIDANVAKFLPVGVKVPLKLNGTEEIGEALVAKDGTVEGEIDDQYRPLFDGAGYAFEAKSTDGQPVESIFIVSAAARRRT